jgi:hypothetical protein
MVEVGGSLSLAGALPLTVPGEVGSTRGIPPMGIQSLLLIVIMIMGLLNL